MDQEQDYYQKSELHGMEILQEIAYIEEKIPEKTVKNKTNIKTGEIIQVGKKVDPYSLSKQILYLNITEEKIRNIIEENPEIINFIKEFHFLKLKKEYFSENMKNKAINDIRNEIINEFLNLIINKKEKDIELDVLEVIKAVNKLYGKSLKKNLKCRIYKDQTYDIIEILLEN